MVHKVSTDSVVYGDSDGNVAFLALAEGVIPPPNIPAGDSRHEIPHPVLDMIYLGNPIDLLTKALNHLYYQHKAAAPPDGDLRKQRAHPQEALARILGVDQQSVSRWATGKSAPRISWDQWGVLVRFVIQAREANLPNG